MSSVQVDHSPPVSARTQDISSWKEEDISILSTLSSSKKKRYYKRKSAIKAYFTTQDPPERIALRYHLPGEMLEKLARRSIMLHEDGAPWGFRALVPGVRVIDHTPAPIDEMRAEGDYAPTEIDSVEDTPADEDEDTAKRKAIVVEEVGTQFIAPTEAEAPEAEPENDIESIVAEAEAQLAMMEFKVIDAGTRFMTSPNKNNIVAQRSIRRHWVRSGERARKRNVHRMIGLAVAAVILLSLLIPIAMGIAAYSVYSSIKGIASDGVGHLVDVKALFPVSKSDPLAVLNSQKLQQANVELTQAQGDFLQLQQLVDRQDIQNIIQQYAPQFGSKLGMAQRLVQVGIDVSRMGCELINVAMLGANILRGSPLAGGSTKPLITADDVSTIEGAMLHALYYINDIKAQMSQVSLNQLPISASQQTLIASAMALLPKAQSYIQQGQGLIGIVSWLLGVGQQRSFLIQTMDSAELRPGGGFTGQYGVLSIQDGRMAPFSLQDVTELDYNGNGFELGRQAPPEYQSWMNFGSFGLRDSNLSADYPTTARLAMQVFQQEGGGPVDGDIAFTPLVIEHILNITGPIKVQPYNETITAQNLEDKLHYYQQNSTAITLQRHKTGTSNAATRKSFTFLLGRLLLDKLRQLPIKMLVKIAQNALKDIQSRDLEIYFTNPQAEAWLVGHDYSGAMSTFSKVDGFMVVQSNISISKASQYVQTTEQDNIVLDAQGGATHNLTITLNYQQRGPVYGYNTYADYIRVYAPANAQFLGGDGFDTGTALCTPAPPASSHGSSSSSDNQPQPGCGQYSNSFPGNARYCPNGNYSLGQRGYVQGKGFTNWPIDSLGPPTELSSDLPGRAMWGGLTVTPKNCFSYISLSWYVPNVVKHVAGQSPYALLVQKQGGYVPIIQISIDTSALKRLKLKPFNYQGNLFADTTYTL